MSLPMIVSSLVLALSLGLAGCAASSDQPTSEKDSGSLQVSDTPTNGANSSSSADVSPTKENEKAEEKSDKGAEENAETASQKGASSESSDESKDTPDKGLSAQQAKRKLNLTEDYSHKQFVHGEKPAKYQKYIVLHDTEGEGSAKSVIRSWAANGNLIAAHFVVNRDGSIVQCVPLDKIAHHAGYGNPGKNKKYGVVDESRDDKLGPRKATKSLPDYGMNSYSVGIEMVHVTGGSDYTEAQLKAVDGLIAYIDAYYGFESAIIDHKAWRAGNSDTSAAFASYLKNYQDHRTHD